MNSSPRRRRKPTELKVVFDTNALYTGSESNLLNRDTVALIRANAPLTEPRLTWCIPRIVLLERQYQMTSRALELLPSIAKLERLLGHNLLITQDLIEERLRATIHAQLDEHHVNVIELDPANVNWANLIIDSALRKPPFEPGEKEKGFRDALVLETFGQLVDASPTTPQICRVVLVTHDALLTEAALQRTSSSSNVTCLPGLNDLASLINTLASQVSEEYVATLEPKAQRYFFAPGDEATLFLKLDLRAQILARFKEQLDELPSGADERINGTWYVHGPAFLKKDRQRVFWASRVSVEAEAYKHPRQGLFAGSSGLDSSPDLFSFSGSSVLSRTSDPGSSEIPTLSPKFSGEGYRFLSSERDILGTSAYTFATSPGRLHSKGHSAFSVTWSASVDASTRFSHARIEAIEFIATSWE